MSAKVPCSVERFTFGQSNPTYLVRSGEHRWVLRTRPMGVTLPTAHAIDREFRVLKALEGSAVPIPRAHAYCADATRIGTSFYLMEYVEGEVQKDFRLPGLGRDERRRLYTAACRTLAALHAVDFEARGLGDFGAKGDYLQRQCRRWSEQYKASASAANAHMDRLIAWLPGHLPASERRALIHGDFRFTNMLLGPDRGIRAVLDWEISTIGDPVADLAWFLLPWHLPAQPYLGLADTSLEELGVPTKNQMMNVYAETSGIGALEHLDAYLVFAMFRAASIQFGIARRARDKTAASDHAEEFGRRAETTAALAARMLDHIESKENR